MRKFAICLAVSLTVSINLQAERVSLESISLDTAGSEETVVEERLTYERRVTQTTVNPDGIVIIPGDNENPDEIQNPFEDPLHFEVTEAVAEGAITYRTKNLTLGIAEDGATINGEFHQWRHKNYSWGVFDRAREIDVSVQTEDGVKVIVDVNWTRKVWGSSGRDTIELSKDEFKTTEEVSDSILDLANDFEQGILKLDSAAKINKLVSLINPFLAEPYTKRLVVEENLTQRERFIQKLIAQSKDLFGAGAQNEFLKRKFIQNYKMGFSAEELIQIADASFGADAQNEILHMGAQAYLYFYSEDDIRKVAKAAFGVDAENKILMLLAERGAGSQANVIRQIPGTSEADLERSRFVSDLLDTARATTSASAHNRILRDGFNNNLDLRFSLTDVLRIARATTSASSQNQILRKAAEYYGPRWSQEDFRILARATTSSSAQNSILEIAADYLNNRRGSGFYDSDIKDDYRRSDSDYKDGSGGGELKEGSDTRVDVRINGGAGSNVRVDVDVD